MDKIKGKRSIRKVCRNMLIVLSTAAVILSAGYIVARLYDYYASARAYRTIEEMYVKHPLETEDKEPSVTESPAVPKEDREIPVAMEPQGNAVPERMKVDWDGLRAANPDVVAWLYVPMTGISYPVVQGGTNDEYLHKSFTGEYRYAGAIFLDSENAKSFTDRNTILYGHNMRDGSMFASLNSLSEEAFAKDPWIWVLTPEKDLLYKAFSYHTGGDRGQLLYAVQPLREAQGLPGMAGRSCEGFCF